MIASIKATIFFERIYWVGSFERVDVDSYAVARHVFGPEPSDAEVYDFVLSHYDSLRFGMSADFVLQIKRMNPKRVQREVRREMEQLKSSQRPSTVSQDYMREELEKNKQEKKQKSRADKEERARFQFSMRQQKRKEKRRGH